MKSFLKNNIFTNPEGWAAQVVGKTWVYRLMQGASVLFGIALFAMHILSSRPHCWMTNILIAVFIALIAIELPLCYLRALRHLYIKTKRTESN